MVIELLCMMRCMSIAQLDTDFGEIVSQMAEKGSA